MTVPVTSERDPGSPSAERASAPDPHLLPLLCSCSQRAPHHGLPARPGALAVRALCARNWGSWQLLELRRAGSRGERRGRCLHSICESLNEKAASAAQPPPWGRLPALLWVAGVSLACDQAPSSVLPQMAGRYESDPCGLHTPWGPGRGPT